MCFEYVDTVTQVSRVYNTARLYAMMAIRDIAEHDWQRPVLQKRVIIDDRRSTQIIGNPKFKVGFKNA
jgi:hypothetical protein